MKKLLCLFLALCCILCAFGCGGNSTPNRLQEMEITGEEVNSDTMKDMLQTRKFAFAENDHKNAKNRHCFDVDIKMAMEAMEDGATVNMSYHIDGKMVFEYVKRNNDLYFDMSDYAESFFPELKVTYDLDLDMTVMTTFVDNEGNNARETVTMKGSLVYVDGVCYAKLTAVTKTADQEQSEEIKAKGELEDFLDIDIDLEEMFGAAETDAAKMYGIDVDALLESVEELGVAKYYVDGDNTFFIDMKQEENIPNMGGGYDAKMETCMQYKITFGSESAIVNEEKVFLREALNYMEEGGTPYGVEIKLSAYTKRISSANIQEPLDSDEYQSIPQDPFYSNGY